MDAPSETLTEGQEEWGDGWSSQYATVVCKERRRMRLSLTDRPSQPTPNNRGRSTTVEHGRVERGSDCEDGWWSLADEISNGSPRRTKHSLDEHIPMIENANENVERLVA